jgi:hypothetical protein
MIKNNPETKMDPLEEIVCSGAKFILDEFGLPMPDAKLNYYSDKSWKKFCELNEFTSESEGMYIPSASTAYVRDSPYMESNVFHEIFGHGLFCDYAIPGKILVEVSKKGCTKEFMQAKSDTRFNITGHNITDYEGFALWMESVL